MITMLLRLIGPLLIQGSRIQLIIFVLTVFTAVSRSGAGQSCGGEWFIISSENQPRLHRHQLCEWPSWGANRRTRPGCHWMVDGGGPNLQAMFDDCRTQCANYTHSTVGIYTIFSAHSYQAMSNIRTFSFRVLQTSVNMKFVWFIATIY